MVEGRTALRSHSRKKGQRVSPLVRTPKASGLTARVPPSCRKWREALRGGLSWAISQPSRGACAVSAAREDVDGGGVLNVPEQLAAPPAGEVAPLEGGVRVLQGDAPPPLRHADGGAVPAGPGASAPGR